MKPSTIIRQSEYDLAWNEAGKRRQKKRKTRDNKSGRWKSDEDTEVMAVAAEIIVARCTGSYPSFLNGYDDSQPDTSCGLEVRATHRFDGHLIIREKDEPRASRYFVLATYQEQEKTLPKFVIQGAILGSDAMVDANWRDTDDGEPAWFVPQSKLIDVRLIMPRLTYHQWGDAA